MTVEFSNTSAAVWNAIQTALQSAGFVISTVAAHLKCLEGDNKKLYVEASKQVLRIAEEKNPESDYTEMDKLLKAEG